MSGRIRRAAAALGLHVARTRNYDLVARNPYSPVPDESELPPDIRDRRSELRGIAFDTEVQIAWAERELAPFTDELEEGDGFVFDNTMYEHGDAEIAYAVVRWAGSRRVVELGSGWSTMVLRAAAAANEADGLPTVVQTNDPSPSMDLGDVEHRRAQDVPPEELEALEDGDVLFVDTTHVIKLGGDVNHVVLDVLPGLARGVLVHFHDIWLPYEYHRALTRFHGVHWNEQYLLQAFLSGNSGYQVLFATNAVSVEHAARFKALVPGYRGANFPTGFWLRRT